ncbi:MAG: hypothetical protein RQ754_10115 [Desulfuromonadales bacterium]|nr:hypothetical protein [Desulfuromonadales bacterium]
MFLKHCLITFVGLALLTASGCGSDDGQVTNSIDLPTDSLLTLYCEDVGIYPNNCVLEDPNNPYRMVAVNDQTKWTLSDDAPSAKSRFYLWATALAHISTGENQYYVATALHELYSVGTSINAKAQAKKAYRSVLDNFYDSNTYWEAWWLPGDPTPVYAIPLKDLTGMRLYDPTPDGLLPLFDDPFLGLYEITQWGYSYDPDFDPDQSLSQTGTLY